MSVSPETLRVQREALRAGEVRTWHPRTALWGGEAGEALSGPGSSLSPCTAVHSICHPVPGSPRPLPKAPGTSAGSSHTT